MTHASIREVTLEAERLRAALTTPTAADLTGRIRALENAAGRFSKLEQEWRVAPPTDLSVRALAYAELMALRRELQAIAPLAEAGEVFWQGWAQTLALQTQHVDVRG